MSSFASDMKTLKIIIKLLRCPKCNKATLFITRKPPIAIKCNNCDYYEERGE